VNLDHRKTKSFFAVFFLHNFWDLIATNNDIEKVRRLAGHNHIATTSRYLKDSYSDLADAVEELPKF
jgi:hypothetical protein